MSRKYKYNSIELQLIFCFWVGTLIVQGTIETIWNLMLLSSRALNELIGTHCYVIYEGI